MWIISQGLPPHPGPETLNCNFDDPEGPDWDGELDEEADSCGGGCPDGWPEEPSHGVDEDANGRDAWGDSDEEAYAPGWWGGQTPDVTINSGEQATAPSRHRYLRRYLDGIGCPAVVASMKADLSCSVWRVAGEAEVDQS